MKIRTIIMRVTVLIFIIVLLRRVILITPYPLEWVTTYIIQILIHQGESQNLLYKNHL